MPAASISGDTLLKVSSDVRFTRRGVLETALTVSLLPCTALLFADWIKASDDPPKFFTPADFEALESITEILIPTDETPGAREARCAHFIDFLLQSSTDMPKVQASWRNAMQTLKDSGLSSGGRRTKVANSHRDVQQQRLRLPPDQAANRFCLLYIQGGTYSELGLQRELLQRQLSRLHSRRT